MKRVSNVYTPDGRKLSSFHFSYIPKGNRANRRITVHEQYVDNPVPCDGKLLMWLFDGGYVDLNANGIQFVTLYIRGRHFLSNILVMLKSTNWTPYFRICNFFFMLVDANPFFIPNFALGNEQRGATSAWWHLLCTNSQ